VKSIKQQNLEQVVDDFLLGFLSQDEIDELSWSEKCELIKINDETVEAILKNSEGK